MNPAPNRMERIGVAVSAFLASAVLLLFGPYSNFAAAGYIDPWFYDGYFTNFAYLARHYGPTYFVSRLPWILPGLAAFHLFSPEVASVLLNVVIAGVSTLALYWAVRGHYGRTPAALACCALLTNPYFISTVSWDYPDGPAIAYGFAGLAFAVRPRGSEKWNTVGAAILLTLAGLTNLAAAPVLISILTFIFWRHRAAPREWTRDALYLATAATATVLVLCPIAQILVGRWTYFYWQVYRAMHTFGNPAFLEKMWGTGPAFLLTASRLFAPVFLLASGAILLLRRSASAVSWAAWWSLAVSLGLYTIQEFVAHGAALRVPYHSSYLIVPVFFLAGVLLGEMRQLAAPWAAAAALLAIALPWCEPWLLKLPAWPILLVLAAVAVIGRGGLPQVCAVAVLFLSPGLDPGINYMWDRPAGRNRAAFQQLIAFQARVKESLDPARPAKFWIDSDEESPMNASAEALYLCPHTDLTHDLATQPALQLREELRANGTLVHLTAHPDRIDSRRKLLAARGIAISNERTLRMPWTTVVLQDVDLSQLR